MMLEFERTEVSLRRNVLLKGFSTAFRFWKANMSPYIYFKYCTVLYHSCCWLDDFSQAKSSISVKCVLENMFSTNFITFLLSVHRTPIATYAAALCMSSLVYLIMWRLGVSDHGVQRAELKSSFSWFWIVHHVVRRCVMRSHIVLLEYPMKSSSSSSRYWGSTLATMSLAPTSTMLIFVHHSIHSVSWPAFRASWSKSEVPSLMAELILFTTLVQIGRAGQES